MDIRDTVERYFENVHLWLPVVSRMRMILALDKPALDMTADLAALLLCMKLIIVSGHSSPQDAQSQLYWLCKRQLSAVESGGLITLQLMQAALLITAYEIGHAIYPAAYLSSGHCIRLGNLLGIHDRQNAPQILRKAGAWSENEEIKRCWWGALLFESYVSVGGEGHSLCTWDPPPHFVLPADDDMWNQGEMTTNEPLYVSSPTNVRAGAFARTCQATNLMGRMVRIMNDRYAEPSIRFSQAIHLHRTMTAFSNVLPSEVAEAPEKYSTALALCYGSLMHLVEPFSCTETNRGQHTVEETEMQAIAIPTMREVSTLVLEFSRDILQKTMTENLASVSPLVADCLYTATACFQWLVHEQGSPADLYAYTALRQVLSGLGDRWAVAGEYIKILEVC
jgi:hypothetical protein